MLKSEESHLQLSWLGPPIVARGASRVKFEMRKALALLAYLTMHEHPVSRDSLAATFWPDFDRERAPANLRRALSSLNASLGGEILKTDRDIVGIAQPSRLSMDVREFKDLVKSVRAHRHPGGDECAECKDRLAKAIGLYRGDFLDGFNLKDSPVFDDWQGFQREELRQLFAWTLEQSAKAMAKSRQWDEALAVARRWLSLDSLQQPAHRMLMSLYASSGQQSAALRQYAECERLLKEELGANPDSETSALHENIREGIFAPKTSGVGEQAADAPSSGIERQGKIAEPVLRTKLFIPQTHSSLVSRPRLASLLESSIMDHALTIVSAPAGYGKSTLVAEWARSSGFRVAWLSLDEGDDDPAHFLRYVAASLDEAAPGLGAEALKMLHSPRPAPFNGVIAALINDIEPLSLPIILVLDDFQVIHSPGLKQAMMYLLDHLPPSLRLVIATRADPPLPLARLRARGGLTEIRMADLRFTEEEGREFLGKAMGLTLNDEEIETLEGRTEGWIAGLQMAALSLRGRRDTRSFIANFGGASFDGNNRLILDYMLEEVFDRLPEELRKRLLQCSILERLCGSLCEAVTGFEDGADFLRQVEKANLFLVSIDDEGRWYRFHRLFMDLLLHKLRQSDSAEGICELHRRAGTWFSENGFDEEAVRHFIKARNFRSAGEAIIRGAHEALSQGANSDLLKWIEALPPEFVRGWFELDAVKAFALLYAGRLPEVEDLVREWEKALSSASDPEKRRLIEGNAALARAALCDIGGTTAEALSFALRAQELLDAPDGILRTIVCHNLLKSYRYAGNWEKAEETYKEYIRLAEGTKDLLSFVVGTHDHAFMMVLRGKLNAAEALYRDIFDTAEKNGVTNNASLSEAYAGMADILRERNELEEAKRLVSEALRRAESWGYPADLLTAHRLFIRVLIAFGEYSQVDDHFRASEEVLRRGGVYSNYASIIESERAKLIYAQNLPKEAGRWLETPKPKTISDDPATLEQELIATARMRILHSRILPEDADAALTLLEALATDAENSGRYGRLIEILVLRAVALGQIGKTEGAIRSLGKALGLAEPEGYVRVFLDEGELMASLLREGMTVRRWAPARIRDYAEYLSPLFNRTSQ